MELRRNTLPEDLHAGLFLAFLAAFTTVKSIGTISTWKYTPWLFDYSLGFHKRALVGSVVKTLYGYPSFEFVLIASILMVVAFVVIVTVLCNRVMKELGRDRNSMLFVCTIFLSPGVLHLIADLGRFDIVNYIVCFLAIAVIYHWKRFPHLVLTAASVSMILIHEAALVTTIPLLMISLVFLRGPDASLSDVFRSWRLLAALFCVLAVFSAIAFKGQLDMDSGAYLQQLAERPGIDAGKLALDAARVATRDSDSVVAVATVRTKWIQKTHFVTTLFYVIVQLVVTYIFIFSRMKPLPTSLLSGLFVALSPLPLFLSGVDWGRWLAFMSLNISAFVFLLIRFGQLNAVKFRGVMFPILLGGVIVLSASDQRSLGRFFIGGPVFNVIEHYWRYDPAKGWVSMFDVGLTFSFDN